MSRERWMAASFAVGSVCFLIGPIGFYARLVGAGADTLTYFVGSVPFTIGGALQSYGAWVDRHRARAGWALLRSAGIQSVGTVFFNITTFRALHDLPTAAHYDRLVWRPDAYGSLCFLISGVIAYLASPRAGWRPLVDGSGWWEPVLNLLGCVLFGVSAIAGIAVSGTIVGPRVSDWGTGLGALCFLVCALATLLSGMTFKSPRLHRWERDLSTDVAELA